MSFLGDDDGGGGGGAGDEGGSAGAGVDGGRMGMTQASILEDRFCVDMKVSCFVHTLGVFFFFSLL